MSQEHSGEELPAYLSTGDAARILGVTHQAVQRLIHLGRVPAFKVGRTWVIPRDVLLEFAKTYVKGPGPRRRPH